MGEKIHRVLLGLLRWLVDAPNMNHEIRKRKSEAYNVRTLHISRYITGKRFVQLLEHGMVTRGHFVENINTSKRGVDSEICQLQITRKYTERNSTL